MVVHTERGRNRAEQHHRGSLWRHQLLPAGLQDLDGTEEVDLQLMTEIVDFQSVKRPEDYCSRAKSEAVKFRGQGLRKSGEVFGSNIKFDIGDTEGGVVVGRLSRGTPESGAGTAELLHHRSTDTGSSANNEDIAILKGHLTYLLTKRCLRNQRASIP